MQTVITPPDPDATIEWASSDPTIATVSSSGLMRAIKAGQVTITAFASNGAADSIIVNVYTTPIGVTAVQLSVYVGEDWVESGFDAGTIESVNVKVGERMPIRIDTVPSLTTERVHVAIKAGTLTSADVQFTSENDQQYVTFTRPGDIQLQAARSLFTFPFVRSRFMEFIVTEPDSQPNP